MIPWLLLFIFNLRILIQDFYLWLWDYVDPFIADLILHMPSSSIVFHIVVIQW